MFLPAEESSSVFGSESTYESANCFRFARTSRRAAAGRAELLAKKGHTGRVQNPAKVSENRPACGTAQHTLAVCFVFEKLEKSRKKLAKIQQNLSKI